MKWQLNLAAAVLATVVLSPVCVAQSTDSFLTGTSSTLGLYTTGANLNGQNPLLPGWTDAWQEVCCGTPSIVGTGLTYPNLPTNGGAAEAGISNTSGRAGRLLETPVTSSTSGFLYMSLLMQAEVDPLGVFTYGGFELFNGGYSDNGQRILQVVQGENEGSGTSQIHDWQLTAGTVDSGSKTHVNLGVNDEMTNLFVLKFDLSATAGSDAVSLFQNPDLTSPIEPGVADATIMSLDLEFDRMSLARFGDNGVLRWDELRIADNYADAVTSIFVSDLTLGDTDGNGVVEYPQDFTPILNNWLENQTTMPSLGREDGDLNLDGMVDILDFREWKNEFDGPEELVAQAFAMLGSSATPEPASTLLMLASGLVFGVGRRRLS